MVPLAIKQDISNVVSWILLRYCSFESIVIFNCFLMSTYTHIVHMYTTQINGLTAGVFCTVPIAYTPHNTYIQYT